MAVSFACPECGKMLKSAAPIAPGKKVKCPGCGEAFAPSAADDKAAVAVTSKVPVQTGARAAPPRMDDDEDDRPRARTNPDRVTAKKPAPGPAFDDDDDDLPRSKRRGRDDDDFDDDDRPKKKKKKRKKAPASKMPLILALAGVGVLLVVGALTAFVWPGFMLSAKPGGAAAKKDGGKVGGDGKAAAAAPEINLLGLAPSDSTFAAQINMKAVTDVSWANKGLQALMKVMRMPNEAKEIAEDCEFIFAAGKVSFTDLAGASGSEEPRMVIAVQTKSPYNLEKIKKLFSNLKQSTVQGQTIFKEQSEKNFSLLATPTKRVFVVAAKVSENELAKLINDAAKGPSFSPDLKAAVEHVQSAQAWFAGAIDDTDRKMLRSVSPKDRGSMASAWPALELAKAATLAIDLTTGAQLKADVFCASEVHASTLKTGVEAYWKNDLKKLVDDLIGKSKLPPGLINTVKQAVADLDKSFKVSSKSNIVSASTALNQNTIDELLKHLPQAGPGGGKPGAGGFPGGPPGGGLPGGPPGGGGFPGGPPGGGGFPGAGGFPGGPPGGGFPGGKPGGLPSKDKGGAPGGIPGKGKVGGLPGGSAKAGFGKDKAGGLPDGGAKNGNLAGSNWAGSENLAGYGALSFVFGQNNQVTMVDKDGNSPGSYVLNGNNVTMTFDRKATYVGTINDNTISGNARDARNNWTFTVKRR